jgi:hypothetical protein
LNEASARIRSLLAVRPVGSHSLVIRTDVIGRLRALFSKRDARIEPLDLSEIAREVIVGATSSATRSLRFAH